jgi:cell wall-associated NlpC family hydrolase
MRRSLTVVCLSVCVLVAGACASTGATPRPFPTPGGSPASRSIPAPEAPEGVPSAEPDALAPEPGYGVAGTALSYRGVRYRNGGSDPEGGFDCSGLVWYVFARHGIPVPRTVAEQYRTGMRVDGTELRAGDLVFFNTTGGSPSHVGISIGGDQFVHAPSASGEVRVEHLGASYWAERFVGIRRMD